MTKGKGFPLFDNAEKVVGLCLKDGVKDYSKKKLKNLEKVYTRIFPRATLADTHSDLNRNSVLTSPSKVAKGPVVQANALVWLKVLDGGKFQDGGIST